MRSFVLVVAVISLFGARLEAADGGKPLDRQYIIETRLFTRDVAGQESTLSAPRVVVVENMQASIRVGAQMPRPGKTRQIEWLDEGIAVEMKIFADDEGKRFLDVHAQYTQRQARRANTLGALLVSCLPRDWLGINRGDTASVRLATRAVRIVEPLRLEEKTTAALDAGTQIEIRVREAATREAVAAN